MLSYLNYIVSTPANDYFHYSADYFFDSTINCWVYETSENSENCPSQFPTAEGHVIKCLLLFCLTNHPKPKDSQFTNM